MVARRGNLLNSHSVSPVVSLRLIHPLNPLTNLADNQHHALLPNRHYNHPISRHRPLHFNRHYILHTNLRHPIPHCRGKPIVQLPIQHPLCQHHSHCLFHLPNHLMYPRGSHLPSLLVSHLDSHRSNRLDNRLHNLLAVLRDNRLVNRLDNPRINHLDNLLSNLSAIRLLNQSLHHPVRRRDNRRMSRHCNLGVAHPLSHRLILVYTRVFGQRVSPRYSHQIFPHRLHPNSPACSHLCSRRLNQEVVRPCNHQDNPGLDLVANLQSNLAANPVNNHSIVLHIFRPRIHPGSHRRTQLFSRPPIQLTNQSHPDQLLKERPIVLHLTLQHQVPLLSRYRYRLCYHRRVLASSPQISPLIIPQNSP